MLRRCDSGASSRDLRHSPRMLHGAVLVATVLPSILNHDPSSNPRIAGTDEAGQRVYRGERDTHPRLLMGVISSRRLQSHSQLSPPFTVRGTAAPDRPICYSFTAAAGQTAQLRAAGNNMAISVIGVGDARDTWTFKTRAQTYTFIVAQLMRSARTEAYVVTLSIR